MLHLLPLPQSVTPMTHPSQCCLLTITILLLLTHNPSTMSSKATWPTTLVPHHLDISPITILVVHYLPQGITTTWCCCLCTSATSQVFFPLTMLSFHILNLHTARSTCLHWTNNTQFQNQWTSTIYTTPPIYRSSPIKSPHQIHLYQPISLLLHLQYQFYTKI